MLNIKPLEEKERKYTYRQSAQLEGQTGSIGYLRGDFGSSGNEFFTGWFNIQKDLKTEDFKAELDEVINALRSDEYGLLKSRRAMVKYVKRYTDSAFRGNYCTEYGFRVDTEKHAFLLRCNPVQGDYNFYCHCFVKELLNEHIGKAEQGIRFIDLCYNELFRIPDGSKIIIAYDSGEKVERTCRFIDECHTEVGNTIYHIWQFAELMKRIGATYEAKGEGIL